MVYSDYGAYVWKNGIDITKSSADKNYFYFKNEKKWNGQLPTTTLSDNALNLFSAK